MPDFDDDRDFADAEMAPEFPPPAPTIDDRRAAAQAIADDIERRFPRYEDCPADLIAVHTAACSELGRLRPSPPGFWRRVDSEMI